jgi:hypothetical protein
MTWDGLRSGRGDKYDEKGPVVMRKCKCPEVRTNLAYPRTRGQGMKSEVGKEPKQVKPHKQW